VERFAGKIKKMIRKTGNQKRNKDLLKENGRVSILDK
jgi:hypothetical protein